MCHVMCNNNNKFGLNLNSKRHIISFVRVCMQQCFYAIERSTFIKLINLKKEQQTINYFFVWCIFDIFVVFIIKFNILRCESDLRIDVVEMAVFLIFSHLWKRIQQTKEKIKTNNERENRHIKSKIEHWQMNANEYIFTLARHIVFSVKVKETINCRLELLVWSIVNNTFAYTQPSQTAAWTPPNRRPRI